MTNHKQSTFDNEDSKTLFKVGMKYLAISLPLLFISPILITVGFKALNKSNNFIVLILGCVLAIFTIVLVVQAFRIILKSLFNK
ncbi:MAG: hypothetical protein KAH72_08655 [Flavobacteriaceae bacterium]|nr:hypothetical protein [Flavobacteriaceae bacterium]